MDQEQQEQEPVSPEASAASDSPDEPLGDGGKRALQAEREARRAAEKAAADAAARIKEYEDRDKSELEKLQEKAHAAEQRAAELERETLRHRVAAQYGIATEDAQELLTGSDEDTLTRQAERISQLNASARQAVAPPVRSTPVEHMRSGAMPYPPEPTLAERIAAAEQQGDHAAARRLKNQRLLGLAQEQKH